MGVGCVWRTKCPTNVLCPRPIILPWSLPPRKIRIVTECSGLEPLPYVFERLGSAGRYDMAAACEIDPICRRVIRLCHTGSARPKKLFKDISLRPPQ